MSWVLKSIVFVSCMSTLAFASAQALVEVEKFVWTDGVDRGNLQFRGVLNNPMHGKTVYLWMQLKGSPALLAALRKRPAGSIPIRHAWYRYTSDAVNADAPDELDLAVDLQIGKKEVLGKLQYEVDAKGAFHWRVWSGKKQLTPGVWRVDLTYASGVPVVCASEDDANQPCKFIIEVKR